jgi:hypothetical protein
MDLRRAPAWIHNDLSQELISPWQGAVAVEDYQLYPVYKALEMPRVSLLLDRQGSGRRGRRRRRRRPRHAAGRPGGAREARATGEEATGAWIVKRSLEEPVKISARNAGPEGGVVVEIRSLGPARG